MLNKKIFLLMLFSVSWLWAQESAPCNVPPFLAQKVIPNIFILMDNSGSMEDQAYWNWAGNTYDQYDSSRSYYGYFDPNLTYEYGNNIWEPTPNPPNYSNRWSGNVLNWAIMSRMSVLKKVLVGGNATARSTRGFAHTLVCESRGSWTKYATFGGSQYRFYVSGTVGQVNAITIVKKVWGSWDIVLNNAKNNVSIDSTFSRGVIQRLADKDADGQWDDDAPRFWLIQFNNRGNGLEMNSSGWNTYDGSDNDAGSVVNYYQGNSSMTDFVNKIQLTKGETWTPLAECLLESSRYFMQEPPLFDKNDFNRGPQWDPMEDAAYWCRKSFVLLLTDGESTRDRDLILKTYIGDYDGDGKEPSYIDYGIDPYNSHYLDDVALWMHTNDLRPEDRAGMQELTLYGIYVFGRGHSLLSEACKDGGFIDYNGNKRPDLQREWDRNGDGVPDTYYEAEEGWEIERAIEQAILDIMARVSSATSVSVISQTQKGEGTIIQAFFQPTYTTEYGTINWIGQVGANFVDKNGNVREDSDGDRSLTIDDYAIKYRVEGSETKAERWVVDSNDVPIYKYDELPLWDVHFLWNAGTRLLNMSASQRNIKAIVKNNSTFALENFTVSNRAAFENYMDGSSVFKDSLINYVRGVDYNDPNWRSRTYEPNKVWKLGDIVYSTPSFVGKPTERYDLIYDDVSYREFYYEKKDRRNIVLVGANDGMLHAFNAGVFDSVSRTVDGLGKNLGEELWAIIPMNLIPHLKWLKDPEYCHVYYVDLKPKVTDAKIFPDDGDHPEGWGTVAIVGMRFGGTPITISSGTYKSAYFMIDVSNPDNPRVLWEFTDPNLGYTISYPSVLKVVEGGEEKWFVVFGSGTTSTPLGSTSTQNAYFYVLDLATGQLLRKIQIPFVNQQTTGAFCGNPVSVDVMLDYSCDVIYLPTTYIVKSGNTTSDKGALYRIVTGNKINPQEWRLSMAMNIDRPLTSGAAVSMDEYGNLWVFFGSGKYFTDEDEVDNLNHYFIGFKDNYWNYTTGTPPQPSHTLSDLLNATGIRVKADTTTGEATVENIPGMGNLSFPAFIDSVNRKYKGWYVQLSAGEKSINFPLVLGGAVFFTTYKVNNDPCGFGGDGWLYVLFYKTGTAAANAPLGLDLQQYAITKVQVEGMPASPAVQIGAREEATAFVQTATGEIVQVQTELPFSPKSGARIWRPTNF